ncbi:MAG: spore maturation protein A [Clostridiales bacterium]|jgi:spore maturation protein A|nr:spore maturation protein A [Clostridiales bacterium]HOA33351.1 nucleoside recognition domain-containing protein [Clostridiales bacterium]HOJ35500.1 nucleoside recognition domain-containing protein [Clostridiales bacterium]HPP68250.1 nucleoside recognition domain-containing protein [Clostridiales bacterium]HQA05999.1 nucleoside recognition domain-containing protein [Clostridiales bacterium]
MISYVWLSLIVFSFIAAIINGTFYELSASIISSGTDAVQLCIKLLGMLCLWSGLMNIAEKSGLTNLISKLFSPLFSLLFPRLKNNKHIMGPVSMNITANLLGLGNAATPLGIEAMKRMKEVSPLDRTASNEMIRFVVLNTAAIHIFPTTVAVLRQSYGSANPFDIVIPAWISSMVTLSCGLLMTRLLERERWKR